MQMSFTRPALKLLIDHFNKLGKRPYGKLLTLGKLAMKFDRDYFNRICRAGGWDVAISDTGQSGLLLSDETVFNALGFEHLDSMDYSDYQWATIVHDLNDINIPEELVNKYDFILDGGTIEHIFNFSNVLENVFKMLKTDGVFFFNQPTFQNLNHGYYNFSPCLFYEYFKANNYDINTFIAYSVFNNFIYIADPIINDICGHIPLIENSNSYICGSVTKTSKSSFNVIPQQGMFSKGWESDYRKILDDTFNISGKSSIYFYGTGGFCTDILRVMPNAYKNKIVGLLSREPEEIGKKLHGYIVYSIDEVTSSDSIIVVATYKPNQSIVYDRIKHLESKGIKIVRLHQSDGDGWL